MSFDEQLDEYVQGECVAEVRRLEAEIELLRRVCESGYIVLCVWREWVDTNPLAENIIDNLRAAADGEPRPHDLRKFDIGLEVKADGKAKRYDVGKEARLIAAAPRMAMVLHRVAHLLAEMQDQSPHVVALRTEIVETIKAATPEHYGL